MTALAFGPDEPHFLVDALLAGEPGGRGGVDLSIHADDEMLAYAAAANDGDRDQALADYVRDGLAARDVVRQLAAWRGGLGRGGPILDFASGFGRATRFLAREQPPERLWIAEILPGAVAFQRQCFGVQGLLSTALPADFVCAERFDLVFVASLFTHLPPAAFQGWLARLVELLRPGGLLAFSVHDAELLPPGRELPAEGIAFEASSESRTLDPRAYGSTWVSEAFVCAAVAAVGEGLACRRLPRGLRAFQDLYLVAAAPETALQALPFDGGPRGYFERCAVDGGRLRLRGWAAPGSPGRRVSVVRVAVGGRQAVEIGRLAERPDVARLAGPEALLSGWECECALPETLAHGTTAIVVRARSDSGAESVVFAGSLQRALLLSTRRDLLCAEVDAERERGKAAGLAARVPGLEWRAASLAARTAELEARMAAMRASRFWKLRDRWFALKRGLGLTDQP